MLDTEILFNAYRRRSGTEPINDFNISIRDRLGNADSYEEAIIIRVILVIITIPYILLTTIVTIFHHNYGNSKLDNISSV